MAIIKCKNCGKEISTKAKQCPHCNINLKVNTIHSIYIQTTKVLSILFLVACLIGGIILGNEYEITTGTYYTYTKFNTILMLASWIAGFVSFVIMYGIACIVENTEKR